VLRLMITQRGDVFGAASRRQILHPLSPVQDDEPKKEHRQDCQCYEYTQSGLVFGVLGSHSCYADFSVFCGKRRPVKDAFGPEIVLRQLHE
jgi:hypothetical protein